MNGFRNWLYRVMQGRYGADALGRFMLRAAFALMIVSFFIRNRVISAAVTMLILLELFRMFSRNFAARARENERYLSLAGRFTSKARNRFLRLKDRDHAYFSCPYCKQKVRVPKGRGRIRIRCPKCGGEFEKET